MSVPRYSRKEVSLHNRRDDCWLIIHGKVYDVTGWSSHPGGADILTHHAGEDATIPFESLHPENSGKKVRNYMAKFYIGELVEEEKQLPEVLQDLLKLKETFIQKGFFNPNLYYLLKLTLVAVSFEIVGVALLWLFPRSWIMWCLASICAFISGAQLQGIGHDLGHNSNFKTLKTNRLVQNILFTFIGGQCSSFWNKRHNEHHAKTNVESKDPDVTFPPSIIMLGSETPTKMGRQRKGVLPHQYQHIYLAILFPTVLLTIGFNIKATIYLYKNFKVKWEESIWFFLFFVRWYLVYSTVCGGLWGALTFFYVTKMIQGLWLSLLTQSQHMTLDISPHEDRDQNWLKHQVEHSYNFEPTWFVNWSTVHANYHIEHHLFPTMPAHNHHLAQPYVLELCEKHGVKYRVRTLWRALADIPGALRRPGEIWLREYVQSSVKND